MLDKKSQDWSADEQFWDEAWTNMEQQLDAEMPQQKPSKTVLWILGFLVLLGAILLLKPLSFVDSEAELATHLQPATNAEQPETTSATRTIQEQAVTSNKAAIVDDKSLNEAVVETAITTSNDKQIKDIAAQKRTKPKSNWVSRPQASKQEKKDIRLTNEVAKSTENQNTVVPEKSSNPTSQSPKVVTAPSTATEEKTISSFTAIEKLPAKQQLLSHEQPMSFADLGLNSPQKVAKKGKLKPLNQRFSFGLEVGASQSNNSGAGFYITPSMQRQLKQKSYLNASLGVQVQKEHVTFSSGTLFPVDNTIVSNPVEDTISSNAFILSGLIESDASFIRTQYVRLGIDYGRYLGKRWTLEAGVGVNYLYAAEVTQIGVTPQFSNRSGSKYQSLLNSTFSTNSVGSGDEYERVAELLDIRRLRYDLKLGIGYRFGRRWMLTGSLQRYVTPVFGNTYATPNWRARLGVRYRF